MKKGFSLLEAMIAIAVFSLVSAGILSVLFQGQVSFQSQREMTRTSEQARIAMDQMVRFLRYAGNDPLNYMKASGIPPVEILNQGHIRINSDVTGSIPSSTANPKESTGEPDGTLSSINERVEFRYDAAGQRLFVDIGYGESLLADRVGFFEFEFLDTAGNETVNSDDVATVKIRMMANTREEVQRGKVNRITLHSDVFLRSKAFNPFEAEESN